MFLYFLFLAFFDGVMALADSNHVPTTFSTSLKLYKMFHHDLRVCIIFLTKLWPLVSFGIFSTFEPLIERTDFWYDKNPQHIWHLLKSAKELYFMPVSAIYATNF